MKPKLAKRSVPNKNAQQRSFPTQKKLVPISHVENHIPSSSNATDVCTETCHSDSSTLCLKPNVPLRTERLLKRDLLRCSNQRPSFLGLQTLQPPRIHPGSQPIHSIVPTPLHHANSKRSSSLSDNPQTLQATIDRIGPWPDVSINYILSQGNDPLQPLKNFRHAKNPYSLSPKYYSTLSDHHTKFKFHPSKQSYIEDYRKQKGYLLSSYPRLQRKSLPTSSLGRIGYLDNGNDEDDDQVSVHGTVSGPSGSFTARDHSEFSTTNLSIHSRGISKSVDDIVHHINNDHSSSNSHLPSIPLRNNQQFRTLRRDQQQLASLPAINPPAYQYVNSINSIDPSYDDHRKLHNPSKIAARAQSYFELRATGSPIMPEKDRVAAVVIYQLARRT
ncbi:unnamed protein product [Adineta ricciae]|uniref:Uncharacterized protein n=1 Tax=Adineta ricciae TaxID=249248 RepID=A0A814HC81_ADIRI|nr:unnamed protein product [Adineta ricciae]